jgi:signal peptidase I
VLAIAASMLLPGLGHWIIRDRQGARPWFGLFLLMLALSLLCLCTPALVPALVALLPLGLILQLATWVSAFRSARRSERVLLRSAPLRFVCAGLLLLLALFSPIQFLFWPIKQYVVEAFVMPTASMAPTIQPRDRFLVHKLRAFKRFDIVVFDPGDPRGFNGYYDKRIVGFPGETIEIKNGGVSVNGQVLQPPAGAGPYVSTIAPVRDARDIHRSDGKPGNGIEGNPITLGPDEYYVLGDNSPISGDSRYWLHSIDGHQPGTLPRSHIKGVATWIYWPISRWRRLY